MEKSVYLRLTQHVLDDPLSALRVIARRVPTLPSAIFSLADGPFPVCSSFWHKISLLCQRTLVTRPSTPLAQTPQRSFQGAAADTHAIPAPNRAHSGSQGETGVFRAGVVSLPSDCFVWFGNPARPGVRTANFAALGLGRKRFRRTQRAFGAAMRLCVSLLRGVAAPLGCATLPLLLRFALREALQAVAETAENTYPPRTVRI